MRQSLEIKELSLQEAITVDLSRLLVSEGSI